MYIRHKGDNMKQYLQLWWKMTIAITQVAFQSRFGAVIFFIGKLLRFFLFIFFLFIIVSKTNSVGGYTTWEVVFIYATFTLIDSFPQFILRNVYRFRQDVVSGLFDYTLLKPKNPLFQPLFGGADILDIPMIILSVLFVLFAGAQIGPVDIGQVFLYILLIINAFFIALAFHIFVLGLGILTTEIDNSIMLYRDITQMGRFPIDIYKQPLQAILTFIVPVGIMITFPAQALMGVLSVQGVLVAFSVCVLILSISLWFWKYSLRYYTSASS